MAELGPGFMLTDDGNKGKVSISSFLSSYSYFDQNPFWLLKFPNSDSLLCWWCMYVNHLREWLEGTLRSLNGKIESQWKQIELPLCQSHNSLGELELAVASMTEATLAVLLCFSLDRIFLATLGKLFLTLTFTLLSFVVVIVRFPKPYNNLNH
jgi:hypothetical protein